MPSNILHMKSAASICETTFSIWYRRPPYAKQHLAYGIDEFLRGICEKWWALRAEKLRTIFNKNCQVIPGKIFRKAQDYCTIYRWKIFPDQISSPDVSPRFFYPRFFLYFRSVSLPVFFLSPFFFYPRFFFNSARDGRGFLNEGSGPGGPKPSLKNPAPPT